MSIDSMSLGIYKFARHHRIKIYNKVCYYKTIGFMAINLKVFVGQMVFFIPLIKPNELDNYFFKKTLSLYLVINLIKNLEEKLLKI
jgi:hypothetical protein